MKLKLTKRCGNRTWHSVAAASSKERVAVDEHIGYQPKTGQRFRTAAASGRDRGETGLGWVYLGSCGRRGTSAFGCPAKIVRREVPQILQRRSASGRLPVAADHATLDYWSPEN